MLVAATKAAGLFSRSSQCHSLTDMNLLDLVLQASLFTSYSQQNYHPFSTARRIGGSLLGWLERVIMVVGLGGANRIAFLTSHKPSF